MRRVAAVALAAALLVAGCSSTSGTPDRSGLSSSTLRQDVYTLTTLAHRGQYVNARAWVAQLQQDVMYARSAGALSVAQENRIVSVLNLVEADLAAKIAASTSRPASSPHRISTAPTMAARSSSPRPQPQVALGAVSQTPAAVLTPTAAPATTQAPRSKTTSKAVVQTHKSAKKHKSADKHKSAKKRKHKRKRPG
jgi:hypothetical protein